MENKLKVYSYKGIPLNFYTEDSLIKYAQDQGINIVPYNMEWKIINFNATSIEVYKTLRAYMLLEKMREYQLAAKCIHNKTKNWQHKCLGMDFCSNQIIIANKYTKSSFKKAWAKVSYILNLNTEVNCNLYEILQEIPKTKCV